MKSLVKLFVLPGCIVFLVATVFLQAKDSPATERIRALEPNHAVLLGEAKVVVDTSQIPPLDMLEPTSCHLRWTVVLTSDQPRQAIEDVFIFVMDDMSLQIEAIGTAAAAETPAEILAPETPAAETGRAAAPVAVLLARVVSEQTGVHHERSRQNTLGAEEAVSFFQKFENRVISWLFSYF